jgi:hypothetical protein
MSPSYEFRVYLKNSHIAPALSKNCQSCRFSAWVLRKNMVHKINMESVFRPLAPRSIFVWKKYSFPVWYLLIIPVLYKKLARRSDVSFRNGSNLTKPMCLFLSIFLCYFRADQVAVRSANILIIYFKIPELVTHTFVCGFSPSLGILVHTKI